MKTIVNYDDPGVGSVRVIFDNASAEENGQSLVVRLNGDVVGRFDLRLVQTWYVDELD